MRKNRKKPSPGIHVCLVLWDSMQQANKATDPGDIQIDAHGQTAGPPRQHRIDIGQPGPAAIMVCGGEGHCGSLRFWISMPVPPAAPNDHSVNGGRAKALMIARAMRHERRLARNGSCSDITSNCVSRNLAEERKNLKRLLGNAQCGYSRDRDRLFNTLAKQTGIWRTVPRFRMPRERQ